MAGNLKLLGSVDLADLPALIASSDAFVAPHMGYTLIEAGLTGVPIVSYDYDFHSEIVEDGNGLSRATARRDGAGRARVRVLLADPPPRQGHGRATAAATAAASTASRQSCRCTARRTTPCWRAA